MYWIVQTCVCLPCVGTWGLYCVSKARPNGSNIKHSLNRLASMFDDVWKAKNSFKPFLFDMFEPFGHYLQTSNINVFGWFEYKKWSLDNVCKQNNAIASTSQQCFDHRRRYKKVFVYDVKMFEKNVLKMFEDAAKWISNNVWTWTWKRCMFDQTVWPRLYSHTLVSLIHI